MIHSIVSMDDIFYKENNTRTRFVRINGGLLEVSGEGGGRQVCRLYSTDPRMYLDRRYSPYSKF